MNKEYARAVVRGNGGNSCNANEKFALCCNEMCNVRIIVTKRFATKVRK